MDKNEILVAIYNTYKIPCAVYSKQNKYIQYFPEKSIYSFEKSELVEYTLDQCFSLKKSVIIVAENNLSCAGVYCSIKEEVIILDSFFLGMKPTHDTLLTILNHHISKDLVKDGLTYYEKLQVFLEKELVSIIKFINALLQQNIDEPMVSTIELYKKEERVSNSILDEIKISSKNRRDSYYHEVAIFGYIEKGDKKGLLKYLNYSSSEIEIGRLANANDPMRQMKNQFISACTLTARAAIRGGISIDTAYFLSDYYIQRVEEIKDIDRINEICTEMFLNYTARVSEVLKVRITSKIVKLCVEYIDENYKDKISFEELANEAGISKNRLLAKFKKETGMSIIDYVTIVRIQEAKALLRFSQLSLVEISENLSFSSQSYFSTQFKKIEGITPKQYREKYLGKVE